MAKTLITDAGIVTRKSFFKRLFCLHYWHTGGLMFGWPDPSWKYTCLRCGKQKCFSNDPVNFNAL